MTIYKIENWGDADAHEPARRNAIIEHGPASDESVGIVLNAPVTDDLEPSDPGYCDGRSGWRWFRFPDGTLVLGVFPQGDIYFATEGDHS